MKNKPFIIFSVLLIVLASLFAGCINPDENDEDEEKKVISITKVLRINETNNITLGDSYYNFTVNNIEGETVFLSINSDEIICKIQSGTPKEIDTDFDGKNNFKINITEISGSEITIILTATYSTSKFNYIKDDTGKTVSVPKKIDKIISLAASVTEILFELNVGNKIVGRDSGSNYPAATKDIEVVSTYEGVDIEKILVKDPDIILMDKGLDLSDTNYNKMKYFGLCVFRVYPKSLQDVLDNVELLGEVTNTEQHAKEIVAELETRINTVRTRDSTQPKVLHVFYFDGSSSPWVHTSSTFSGDLIQIAGGTPAVIDNAGRAIQITIEQMIDLNPDIIFTSQDQTWPTPSRESIIDDEALQDITAVKNDMVIDVNADLVDRPGPRLVDGLELFSNYITSLS